MMESGNIILQKEEKFSSAQATDAAKKTFAGLMLTSKNLSLYPEGHSISANSIRQFHTILTDYLLQYGDYRIEIEKDRVTCQGEEVYAGQSVEGTLPFTLFRDGIRWLEFSSGMAVEEIQGIMSIINRYSVLSEEPEGDIVTDFWEARFAHFQYEVADFFGGFDQEQSAGDSQFNKRTAKSKSEGNNESAPISDPPIDPTVLKLSFEELDQLHEMIHREEEAPPSAHLNMLLDSLLQYREKEDFSIILNVLSEEFVRSFSIKDFEASLKILDGLRQIINSGRLQTPWSGPLIEAFFTKMSDADHLKLLEETWSRIDEQHADLFRRFFEYLQPRAVDTLATLLLVPQPKDLQVLVEDTIISMILQEPQCLEPLFNDSDDRVVARLVPVLSRLGEDRSMGYMTKLLRHESVSVRRTTIKAIAQTGMLQAAQVFNLIDDPDAEIRRIVLRHLGRSRDRVAEDLLLAYLQNHKFTAAQDGHVIDCFKTLGRCGSSRSVPFLRETLMYRKWMATLRKSADQQGAAIALAALQIPESRQVLEEAGRSIHPGLRSLVREVAQESSHKSKGG